MRDCISRLRMVLASACNVLRLLTLCFKLKDLLAQRLTLRIVAGGIPVAQVLQLLSTFVQLDTVLLPCGHFVTCFRRFEIVQQGVSVAVVNDKLEVLLLLDHLGRAQCGL